MTNEDLNPCIIVPVYNHERALAKTLPHLHASGLPIILIDDGSSQECQQVMSELAAKEPSTTLISLPHNLGKGGALKVGLAQAQAQGFSHALQIDADGQHNSDDIPHFILASRLNPKALICGYPIYDESVPKHRFFARYLTHIWVWINSLSLAVKDSMCGFRLYPIQAIVKLFNEEPTGNRMEFESEIAVRWVWRGGEVINLPTRVSYPLDGLSHFAPWRDNLLISKMHASLFFGMLRRLPLLLGRKLTSSK